MKKMTKTVEIGNSCLRYMYDWDDTPGVSKEEKKGDKGGKKEEEKGKEKGKGWLERARIVTRQRSQSSVFCVSFSPCVCCACNVRRVTFYFIKFFSTLLTN